MSGKIGSAGANSGVVGETEPFFEEGTFTPTMELGTSGATVDGNTRGFYTRLGQRVFFQLYFKSTGGSFVSTQLRIGGLPFAAGTSGQEYTSEIGMNSFGTIGPQLAVGNEGNNLPSFQIARGQSRLDGYDMDGTAGDYASSSLTSTTFHFLVSGQYVTQGV